MFCSANNSKNSKHRKCFLLFNIRPKLNEFSYIKDGGDSRDKQNVRLQVHQVQHKMRPEQ